jgi:hypothetical protein
MTGGGDIRLDTPLCDEIFKVCTTDSLCPRRYVPTELASPASLLECRTGKQIVTTDAFASRC